LFPEERIDELDDTLLAKMGLTKKCIQEKDALFSSVTLTHVQS
jgi:hypothetical protein